MNRPFSLRWPLAAVLAACGGPSLSAQDRITPELLGSRQSGVVAQPAPRRAVLVGGKVEAVAKDPKADVRGTARVAVTHTYWGELPAGATSVTDHYSTAVAEVSRRNEADIPFEVGEEGLWVVVVGIGSDIPPRVVFRVRKKHDARYPEVVRQAEFLEAVGKLDPDKRLAFALGRVTDPAPEMAAAAANVAAAADPARARDEVLKRAAGGKVPVAAQVALDRALSARLGEDWRGSDRRAEFLAGWPARAKDEAELLLVVDDLAYLGQFPDRQVPAALAARLVAGVAADEKAPKAARLRAIDGLNSLSGGQPVADRAFDAYAAVLETSRDEKLRRRAAQWLPGLIDRKPARADIKPTVLSPAQIDRLHKISEGEKDAEVRKHLAAAIEKAGAAPARPKGDK
ncbi:MAG: hypothetical protein K2X82_30075 [Gemmataceae bacterium]|nr:hypothetical protein [Gemmataceae bacterium]